MAVVAGSDVVAEAQAEDAKTLPELLAGMPLEGVGAVCVTVGPGSFTGLRSALSLASGFAMAREVALVAVTVAEALGEAFPHLGGRALWVALDSRRERVFLDRGEGMIAVALADLPPADGRVALAGDAAREVAAVLAARGTDVLLTDARRPRPRDVAAAARRRLSGEWQSLAAVPMYVDAPAARLPT